MSAKLYKQKLRKSFSEKRELLPIYRKKELDNALNQKLIQLIDNSDYRNVHVFLPMRSEPNIYSFINHLLEKEINVVCPKSLPKGKLENYVLKSTKQLSKGIYGTSYPANSKIHNGSLYLIIVPGLAYSKQNESLRYGGGYYDRFLLNHKNSVKVAPAYEFQVVDSLPSEDHDIKMDEIISP